MAAAQTMLEHLGKAGLPTGMQSAIAEAISAKVAAPDAEAADPEARAQKPKKGQQCHKYLHHFLCESDWKSLQGSVAFQAKQQTLAKRLVAMGLTNPTESTYVLGVAVLYLSQHAGPAETLQVSPQDGLNTLEELKVKLRAWAKRGTHSGLSEYPKAPQELPQQLYNAAFAVEGPASCPLDEDQLLALADWLPARKSKATLLATRRARSLFEGMPKVTPKQHLQRNSLPQLALPAPETAAAPEAEESVDRRAELVNQHLQNKRKGPSDKDEKPSKTAKVPKAASKRKAEPKPKTATKAKSATNKLPTKGSTEARDPITLEKCSVYTCPKSQNWRVKLHGERKDKAFSWKSGTTEAWTRLKEYVQGL
ncbi:unnamed protein product [Symbiodinium sp. CCMP2592]|nr:unnamed protein product [Symbiodinium sp. CCMP2592]